MSIILFHPHVHARFLTQTQNPAQASQQNKKNRHRTEYMGKESKHKSQEKQESKKAE